MIHKIFFSLLVSVSLFAEAFLTSEIPLPKTYIFNLDPYACDETCLNNLVKNDLVFSFLAYTQEQKPSSKELKEEFNIYVSIFNIGTQRLTSTLKIAMLLPYKKIGKYATTTTNAVFAYLITRNCAFELKSFTIATEEQNDIAQAIEEINQEGYDFIIAPLTLKGAQNLVALAPSNTFYLPTIHRNDIETSLENIYFGAIDYKEQSKELLKEASNPLVIFYDKSYTGKKLTALQEEIYTQETIAFENLLFDTAKKAQRTVIKYAVASRTTNLERELKENTKLENSSVMLDTPLVKSGMIMSQLTLYDINATNILSTQINYDPLILSITQYNDRRNMIIANSITIENNPLIEANALLGNDIVYDWINYTTTIGVDYFFHIITDETRKYDIPVVENQFLYPIELKEPSFSRFVKHYRDFDQENIY